MPTTRTYIGDATGLPRSTPTEAVPQPYRYAGAYADPTGLYKVGHRYYDPTLGRFTQPDPTAAAVGGMVGAGVGQRGRRRCRRALGGVAGYYGADIITYG
ncbi:RHS repeat-associated core domain-containing protein [Streptomyces sp. NPDC060311]|uniref:RHS repeat-associated core domain-containing protein n=1 Tax=Streptomyces sp. NPDC060311 TaxID=3347096 RepID=UPI003663930E